jgi:hypothetical protein
VVEVRNNVKHKNNEKCVIKLDTLKENEKNEMKLKVNEDTELNVSVMIKYKFNSGNKGGTNGNEGKVGMNSGNASGGGGGIMSRLKMFDKSFKGTNPSPAQAPIVGRQPSKTVVSANTNVPKINVEEKVNNSSSSNNNNNTVKNETSVNDNNKVTGVNVGSIGGFMFTAKNGCYVASKTAKGNAFRVYNVPLSFNRFSVCHIGFHTMLLLHCNNFFFHKSKVVSLRFRRLTNGKKRGNKAFFFACPIIVL